MLTTREAVQALGQKVREARSRIRECENVYREEDTEHDVGFIEGVAQLAGLMAETIEFAFGYADSEEARRAFLKDCGFDGEQTIG